MDTYRKVKIKRKLPFYHEQQQELQDWFSDASTAIGSYWEKAGSSRKGNGLNFEEENLLMPIILSVPKEDPTFRAEVAKYFRDINTIIPHEGLELTISLENDNKPLSAKNMPVNVEDFVIYRHALYHPFTGADEIEAKANPLKKYYIEDGAKLVRQQREAVEEIDKAMQDYYTIKQTPKKVEMVLTLMGKNIEPGEDPIVELSKIVKQQPSLFHKVANDADLQVKYELRTLVANGVLDLVKGRFIRTDTAESLGTELQTVAWFKAKENSKDVTILRAMAQETEI
jgi:hypothetical protein